jgi:hypothetical protein
MRRFRGRQNAEWIEAYCLIPAGPEKGQRVRLTPAQREVIFLIYDYDGGQDIPVTQPLAAYLALLHVCGPEAVQHKFSPAFSVDIFTVWNAVGPDLRAVLKRDGAAVVCPELGTRYQAA